MPHYQHDCDKCQFLGTIKTKDQGYGTLHDIYLCKNTFDDVLARYGNNGPEYAYYMLPELAAYPQETISAYREHERPYMQAMALMVKNGLYKGPYASEFPESLINLAE